MGDITSPELTQEERDKREQQTNEVLREAIDKRKREEATKVLRKALDSERGPAVGLRLGDFEQNTKRPLGRTAHQAQVPQVNKYFEGVRVAAMNQLPGRGK